jgi:hypothetical protein
MRPNSEAIGILHLARDGADGGVERMAYPQAARQKVERIGQLVDHREDTAPADMQYHHGRQDEPGRDADGERQRNGDELIGQQCHAHREEAAHEDELARADPEARLPEHLGQCADEGKAAPVRSGVGLQDGHDFLGGRALGEHLHTPVLGVRPALLPAQKLRDPREGEEDAERNQREEEEDGVLAPDRGWDFHGVTP